MPQPLISIIIPTYNSSKTLKACLDSVFEQTAYFEVLVIDSLSTDGTLNLLEEYTSKHTNINVYSEKDKGIYDAMNKGMDLAKGEWLFFLGSDDVFYNKDVLTTISKKLTNTDREVVYGDVQIVGDTAWAKNGEIYAGKFSTEKLLNQNICHQAIFYKRDFMLKQVGYYNLDYVKSADWDLNLRFWSKTKFAYTKLTLVKYSVAGFSGNSGDANLSKDFVKNVMHYFNFSPFNHLINTSKFVYYKDVLQLQSEKHPLRYKLGSVKRGIRKVLKKFS
ncbi:MAG: glycosyltransferase [Bacteroidetes bacterium]|nr:glycosyltransferase [Bacteroidota bacterium]